MDVQTLIDAAAAKAGNRAKLAKALGVPPPNVTQWANGARHCPDEKIVAMAQIAGLPPRSTWAEVAWRRLGKLATTSALGAVVTLLGLAGRDADAHAAGLKPSEHYV